MKKILILVEGQTEERFVKSILSPHFNTRDIYLAVTVLNTKKVKDGQNFKGGVNNYIKVKNDLSNLFYDSSANLITTLFDYYGLPNDFPQYGSQQGNCYQKVKCLEEAFAQDIDKANFLPYLQLHEFEALLFSSPQGIIDTMPNSGNKLNHIKQILASFNTPEEINNSPETCPSKRLINLFPEYKKPLYGTLISSTIGLDTMRSKCTHFNEWITKLESI